MKQDSARDPLIGQDFSSFMRLFLLVFSLRRERKEMYFNQVEFGQRLKKQRLAAGMTQEELAKRIGSTTKQHISRVERGVETCSIDLLVEIISTLHVSADSLLMETETDMEDPRSALLTIISQLAEIAQRI